MSGWFGVRRLRGRCWERGNLKLDDRGLLLCSSVERHVCTIGLLIHARKSSTELTLLADDLISTSQLRAGDFMDIGIVQQQIFLQYDLSLLKTEAVTVRV